VKVYFLKLNGNLLLEFKASRHKTSLQIFVLHSKGIAIFWVLLPFSVYIPFVHNFQLFQYPSHLILVTKRNRKVNLLVFGDPVFVTQGKFSFWNWVTMHRVKKLLLNLVFSVSLWTSHPEYNEVDGRFRYLNFWRQNYFFNFSTFCI